MENLVIELSRYIIIILTAIYTLYCFTVFHGNDKRRQNRIFRNQSILMYLVHFVCYGLLYLNSYNTKIIILYCAELIFFIMVHITYRLVYKNLSRLVLNNMLMLCMFSFVMLTRLSYDKAVRQFLFACTGFLACLIVPAIINKFKLLSRFGVLYGISGILLLLIVLVFGKTQYGARNWLSIFGIQLQPSEFVKIIFVFFTASILSRATDFFTVVKVTAAAAGYVIILVLEKDLGGALIFFITYLIILYVATARPFYLLSGLAAGSVGAAIAYQLFHHVRVRVIAWQNPFQYIDYEGYQISQSLFAIGTGGWFGMGLSKGLPTSIPVVDSDFIFSAISEELGGLTAICIVLICISCFIMFVNIALKLKQPFYRNIAVGLSTLYIFQVFLSIGGATKFIPSTGVTLPLVSYGGSSILSTIIIFSIIQGLYVLNQSEGEQIEENKKRRRSKKRRRAEQGDGSNPSRKQARE